MVDFFNKRVTDLKSKKEIIIPKQAGVRNETEFLALRLEIEQTLCLYINKHCLKDGVPNLLTSEVQADQR